MDNRRILINGQVVHHDDLNIVYEDRWLIVVGKPSGMLTMSTGKADEVTAYSLLYDYMRGTARRKGPQGQRIFIVHRLDRDTSGLLVFAKDPQTKEALQENWNEAVLERKYTAILEGHVEDEEGWIETWLYENPKSMMVHCRPIDSRDLDDAREGRCRYAEREGLRFASSHCRTIRKGMMDGKPYSMVEFELETGRKNQIRVHSQWIGHPIAGDRKYGAATNPIGRLALHASSLVFIHPWTGKTMKFISKLPSSFRKF